MAFTATTVNSAAAWRPDLYTFAPEDVIPAALIIQTSTRAGQVEGDQPAVRCAYAVDDEAQFTAEGVEIPEGEPTLAERLVYTAKVTQLIRLSREQFGQEGTAGMLSASVGRAIIRRADLAYVAEAAPTPPANAPAAGLVNVPNVTQGAQVSGSLDGLVDLVAQLQDSHAMPSHILVDPLGWGELRKLKTAVDFNSSLLGAGTTDATPMLLSLPVIVNTAVPDYTGIVVDRTAVVSAYGNVQVATSYDQYFSSDSVGLRATWRFGSNVVRPERIGVFDIAQPGS